MRKSIALFSLLLGANFNTLAQDTIPATEEYRNTDSLVIQKVVLMDGMVLVGRVKKLTSDTLFFATKNFGLMKVPVDAISSWERETEEEKKVLKVDWFENTNASRYFFSPSAYALGGENYYLQNNFLLLNSFYAGITKNITVGGGFELMSLGQGSPMFYTAPKYSMHLNEKLNMATGILYLFRTGDRQFDIGVGYMMATYGSKNSNVSLGVGVPYFEGVLGNWPVFNVSGMHRVGERFCLVSENWIIPGSWEAFPIHAYGIRFLGKVISVDLALYYIDAFSDNFPLGLPYVDFVIAF